jgi:phage portal protein BeeE
MAMASPVRLLPDPDVLVARQGPASASPQDPARLAAAPRENGRLVFEDRTEGQAVTRDSSEIIYVRAPATNGGVQGLAPITLLRMGISTGLKRQTFEGGYYDNAEPRVVLSFPKDAAERGAGVARALGRRAPGPREHALAPP